MNPQDFLENILFSNPLLMPIGVVGKAAGALPDREKQAPTPKAAPQTTPTAPTAPPGQPTSTTPDLPPQLPVPPGGMSADDLVDIITKLEAIKQKEAQEARDYYPTKAAIDLETYRQQVNLAERAGLEKMREKTARDIELQTIQAWQGITQAQMNRDATIGLGMMNLAYAAGVPNPNVLQAGASLVGQGRSGFSTPFSTIS